MSLLMLFRKLIAKTLSVTVTETARYSITSTETARYSVTVTETTADG